MGFLSFLCILYSIFFELNDEGMKNTYGGVSYHIGVRQAAIRHFCEDFKIKLKDQFIGNGFVSSSILKEEFIKYLLVHQEFLRKYNDDYYSDKTPEIIAETISRKVSEVEVYLKKFRPNEFKDGIFFEGGKYPLRYISSYKIDYELGGDYSFLAFDVESKSEQLRLTNKISDKIELIGYEDILVSVLEQLEPILNPHDANDWGLSNPGGILLFGPPGCGKTFWASAICKLINYEFQEIPRSIFGSSFVDGAMINLKKKLDEVKSRPKTVLFFDEFDSIASARNNLSSGSSENSKVVNTLLQEIPKLINSKILIIAATNHIESLDTAVVRPGRFDLKIPVFHPNIDERSKLIVYNLCKGLQKESPLLKIIQFNKADEVLFWKKISGEMLLFSASMVIDYTQLIKRRLKLIFSENPTTQIRIDEELLQNILSETSTKFTTKDAEMFAQFYNEVKNLGSHFYQERLDSLYSELEKYFSRFKKPPPQPIGFRKPKIE